MGRPCATAVVVTVGPAVRVAARATNGGTATRHGGLFYGIYRYVCMLLPRGLLCGCKGFVSVLKFRGFWPVRGRRFCRLLHLNHFN
jgi:hypothetical protein